MSSDPRCCKLLKKLSRLIIGRLEWVSNLMAVTLFSTLTVGCGVAEGPFRVPVSGTVELDDSPLLTGVIRFIPIGEQGGPAASARIIGGEFEFSSEDGPVIANHRVEIEATEFLEFAIDDETAFAAEFEQTGMSPLANNPIPAIYNIQSNLTASVSDTRDQSFTFNLKTEQ